MKKTPCFLAIIFLGAASWSQNPAPAPAGALQSPPKPNEEMVKWIETVDAQWQAIFAKEVTAPFDADQSKAAQQYSAGVEAGATKASSAGNLDLTLVWRNERDRFASEKAVPAEDDATTPEELKQLRTAWRAQMVRLEKERGERTKSVHARYDQVLTQAQMALTQKQRIEDALLVKNKREEVAAQWKVQSPAPAAVSAMPIPSGNPATLTKAKATPTSAASADEGVEHIGRLEEKGRGSPVQMGRRDHITTRARFKPPVAITFEAKTESTDLRIGYAAQQVIFNWENNPQELRIDGGPANKLHKAGAGAIPPDKYVKIRWEVTPKRQTLFVDGELRYEHAGDYSTLDNPVSVFTLNSKATVRTIKVKALPPGTE